MHIRTLFINIYKQNRQTPLPVETYNCIVILLNNTLNTEDFIYKTVQAHFFFFLWFIYHPCAQSHLTLCGPMKYSPPGSFVHGILQARILEWVAISFSWGSLDLRD